MICIKISITYDIWKLQSFLLSNHIAYSSSYSDCVFVRPSIENMKHLKSCWGKFPIPLISMRLSNTISPDSSIRDRYNDILGLLNVEEACSSPTRNIKEVIEYSTTRKDWMDKSKTVFKRHSYK